MSERKASMGDKVYRGDVVRFIRDNISLDTFMKRTVKTADEACWDLCDKLNYVPAIEENPEPHWIPVTENCDCDLMDNEEVLVFQKDGTINGQIRHAMFYDFNGKKKFVTWEEGITIYHVVAYMPLPEPFKGVTDGRF